MGLKKQMGWQVPLWKSCQHLLAGFGSYISGQVETPGSQRHFLDMTELFLNWDIQPLIKELINCLNKSMSKILFIFCYFHISDQILLDPWIPVFLWQNFMYCFLLFLWSFVDGVLISLLLWSEDESVLVQLPCCIQRKMCKLYRKCPSKQKCVDYLQKKSLMVIYFSDLNIFGISILNSLVSKTMLKWAVF